MSEQLTPITPAADPDEIELHEGYAARIADAKTRYDSQYQTATEDYNRRLENIREAKNPTPIHDLMRDMGKRDRFNERMQKLSERDLTDLTDILVSLTENPDLTAEAPNIFNMTNEQGAVLDELTATRSNMRYLTGHSPQVIPTLLADPRLDAAIMAGNPELYRYTRTIKNFRGMPEDQQQRYHALITNRTANLTDADIDPANHTPEDHGGLIVNPEENLSNLTNLARRFINSIPPAAEPTQVITNHQRFKPAIQTAVIEEAHRGYLDAYLFGQYAGWYRPIMPTLEAILTTADLTIENIITGELKRREEQTIERAEARLTFHLEHMLGRFPGMRGGHFGPGRSHTVWNGKTEIDADHAGAFNKHHEN